MLGIIHRDREGTEVLERRITEIDPAVITLEFSRYGRDFRSTYGPELEGRIREAAWELEGRGHTIDQDGLKDLLAYVEHPHEFRVASRWAATRNIPLYLVDMDLFSYLGLRKMDELLDPENMEKVLLGKTCHEDGEGTLARLFFEHGVRAFPYPEEMRIRDRYIRDRIATLRRCHRNSRILHICGWRHLSDPDNVYKELNPVKVFVHDRAFRI